MLFLLTFFRLVFSTYLLVTYGCNSTCNSRQLEDRIEIVYRQAGYRSKGDLVREAVRQHVNDLVASKEDVLLGYTHSTTPSSAETKPYRLLKSQTVCSLYRPFSRSARRGCGPVADDANSETGRLPRLASVSGQVQPPESSPLSLAGPPTSAHVSLTARDYI